MTEVAKFLKSGATAYPCGNRVQAEELLRQIPDFDGVEMAPSARTPVRSRLTTGTRRVVRRSVETVK